MESDHFMCTGSMHVHDHNVTPCKPGHNDSRLRTVSSYLSLVEREREKERERERERDGGRHEKRDRHRERRERK